MDYRGFAGTAALPDYVHSSSPILWAILARGVRDARRSRPEAGSTLLQSDRATEPTRLQRKGGTGSTASGATTNSSDFSPVDFGVSPKSRARLHARGTAHFRDREKERCPNELSGGSLAAKQENEKMSGKRRLLQKRHCFAARGWIQ
jgi:hypothetical protein